MATLMTYVVMYAKFGGLGMLGAIASNMISGMWNGIYDPLAVPIVEPAALFEAAASMEEVLPALAAQPTTEQLAPLFNSLVSQLTVEQLNSLCEILLDPAAGANWARAWAMVVAVAVPLPVVGLWSVRRIIGFGRRCMRLLRRSETVESQRDQLTRLTEHYTAAMEETRQARAADFEALRADRKLLVDMHKESRQHTEATLGRFSEMMTLLTR